MRRRFLLRLGPIPATLGMDNEKLFLEKLSVSGTYPDSLIHHHEPPTAVRTRREHYRANRAKIFDRVSSRTEAPLIIIDFDDDDDASEQEGPKGGAKLHVVRNVAGLERELSWPSSSAVDRGSGALTRDPALRIV